MKLLGVEAAYPVDQLRPHPRNARTHDNEAIKRALGRGQHRSIVVRQATGEILAGNGVYAALMELGRKSAVVSLIECDDDEATEILLEDNRAGELGGYDHGLLASLLQEVDERGRLEAVGYDQDYLASLLAEVNPPVLSGDPDDAPGVPSPDDVISKVGDVWKLGDHRLLCGDSTKAEDMARLAIKKADMVWTDPPYGVNYVGKTAEALTIKNDGSAGLDHLLRSAFTASLSVCVDGAPWYVAAPPGPQHLVFGGILNEMGLLKQELVWVKDAFVLGHSDYHYRHEPIFYGNAPGKGRSGRGNHEGSKWRGDHAQDSVWEIDRPKRSTEHPTMKPVELVVRAIRNSSIVSQVVLDPFGGSGTTLIAAHQEGRIAYLMELAPEYVDVICRRFQEQTGILPIHEATGETVDFIETKAMLKEVAG